MLQSIANCKELIKLDYHFEDFTTENYARLLDIAKERFLFINYNEIVDNVRFVVWRHDIDVAPHRALDLAKIEYEKNVKST